MAVVLGVDELFGENPGTVFDASNYPYRREYQRVFLVQVDNPQIGSIQVVAQAMAGWPIPIPFSAYVSYNGLEYDLQALCIKIAAAPEPDTDGCLWKITCSFSTEMPPGGQGSDFGDINGDGFPDGQGGSGGNNAANPENDPPVIGWDSETAQKTPQKDLDGLPYVNSAGQPYTPAPQYPVAHYALNYERNELGFDKNIAEIYAYAVNADEFLGSPPGTVQCMPIISNLKHIGGKSYWRTKYRFVFSRGYLDDGITPDLWQPIMLDSGFMKLDALPGELTTRSTDSSGEITMETLFHLLQPGQTFGLYWNDGASSRLGMDVDSVAGAVVSMSGGTGDILPDAASGIYIGKLVHIMKNGMQVSAPVLLDGKGGELPPGGTPVFRQHKTFKQAFFNNLLVLGVS
jgi:hypothetical protein